MQPRSLSLFAKLALALGALSVALSIALTTALQASHEAFHLEMHQRFSRPLAARLLSEAVAAGGALDATLLFARVRELGVTNPGLAAYIVDHDGAILAASRPAGELRRRTIAVEPIRQFVAGPARWPLTGEDPVSVSGRTIFSAAPTGVRGQYLYVALDSHADGEGTALLPAALSYSMRDAVLVVLGNVVGALLAALGAAWFITKPVARLRLAMESFSRSGFQDRPQLVRGRKLVRDEIDELAEIFEAMAVKIGAQLEWLRQADRLRRDLFANISHDLRTPLTAVHGYAERLLRKGHIADAERVKYLEVIRRHSLDLTALVEQIMELAKLDAHGPQIRLAPVRLHDLVREVVSELAPLADERRLTVTAACADLCVPGDAGLLRRALYNLLDNAFRQSPAGECIEIRLSRRADGWVEIGVSDRGPGIPEEDLEAIFQRFRRGGAPNTDLRGGAGLGLPIVRRIAELHGGGVSAENRAGGGATFRIAFPASGP